MAMQPFCGYNFGDYWQHWLNIGAQLARPPRIYRHIWFRRDAHGSSWSAGVRREPAGARWMLDRCGRQGNAGRERIGPSRGCRGPRISGPRAGLIRGCGCARACLTVDAGLVAQGSRRAARVSGQFGSRLPAALLAELASTKQRPGPKPRGRPPPLSDYFAGEVDGGRRALLGQGAPADHAWPLICRPVAAHEKLLAVSACTNVPLVL